jgi:hypothetical protein
MTPFDERLLPPIVRRRCEGNSACLELEVNKVKRENLITNSLLFGGIGLLIFLGGWKKIWGVTSVSLAAMRMSLQADLWREK